MAREYREGMIVTHPNMPQWGPGKVVHVEGIWVWVIFRDAGGSQAVRINGNVIGLGVPASQRDAILEGLPPARIEQGQWVVRRAKMNVREAIDHFRRVFPGGFDDPAYLGDDRRGERVYKWHAHEAWVKDLGDGAAEKLYEAGRLDELSQRATAVIERVHLLSRFEIAGLRWALRDTRACERFFGTLLALLNARTIDGAAYKPFAESVRSLPTKNVKVPVATWPVATILPFLAQPDRHLFVKPPISTEAADRLGFWINYRREPNWDTYEACLRMGAVYIELLQPLHPRDMIDVCSFLWVIYGGYGDPLGAKS